MVLQLRYVSDGIRPLNDFTSHFGYYTATAGEVWWRQHKPELHRDVAYVSPEAKGCRVRHYVNKVTRRIPTLIKRAICNDSKMVSHI